MRYRMKAMLAAPPAASPPPKDAGARPVRDADHQALAALMLDAYRGTVDDAGEGPDECLAEVRKLLDGGYGPFNWHASELIERDGTVVAATLVTDYDGGPMIAFSLTAKAWQRRGLGRAGLLRTMDRLRAAGRERVDLAVTAANTPALRLYESLNFVIVPKSG
jgi:ribosomal protein S18 acetylase RimI-like enzyme